jgi:amidohydrolase
MAILLGVAKVLTELKSEIRGTVRLIFQPSEEKFPSGALEMVEAGVMSGVDFIMGIHLWQPLATGVAGISYGCLMASPDEFTISVQGKGGHGSMPQDTVCALSTGAQIICALNAIVGRSVDPLESAVISPGMFHSGEVFNITPDNAIIKGTIRSFNEVVRSKLWNRLDAVCDGICRSMGATCKVERIMGHPPVINNPEVAAIVAAAAEETLGESNVREISPSIGGEDFSYFLQQAPGMFLFLGIGSPEKGVDFPHHHPRFDIDESVLTAGVEIMVRSVVKLQD